MVLMGTMISTVLALVERRNTSLKATTCSGAKKKDFFEIKEMERAEALEDKG